MEIKKVENGNTLDISLIGRLDTATAPVLETVVKEDFDGKDIVTFDFSALEYISSAGLRVLLSAQKMMNKQGSMVIKNVNDTVNEVFEITGFSDILTIE